MERKITIENVFDIELTENEKRDALIRCYSRMDREFLKSMKLDDVMQIGKTFGLNTKVKHKLIEEIIKIKYSSTKVPNTFKQEKINEKRMKQEKREKRTKKYREKYREIIKSIKEWGYKLSYCNSDTVVIEILIDNVVWEIEGIVYNIASKEDGIIVKIEWEQGRTTGLTQEIFYNAFGSYETELLFTFQNTDGKYKAGFVCEQPICSISTIYDNEMNGLKPLYYFKNN